jgi:hypothetical protein
MKPGNFIRKPGGQETGLLKFRDGDTPSLPTT